LPNTDKIMSRVFDLEARLRREPAIARGQLRDLLREGTIRMDVVDGRYVARGTMFPLGLVLGPKPQYAEAGRTSAYYRFSSGGAVCTLIYAISKGFLRIRSLMVGGRR
jgi:hypothetical protein